MMPSCLFSRFGVGLPADPSSQQSVSFGRQCDEPDSYAPDRNEGKAIFAVAKYGKRSR